jgi:DNA mismatch repair ATPase MutS
MGEKLLDLWKESYSYDKRFLTQSQDLYKTLNLSPYEQLDNTTTDWNTFKEQTNFLDKYNYLDWSHFLFLNNNSMFLQCSCINTILSPIMTIILPILLCIIPFIILKMRNKKLTLDQYYGMLKHILSRHPLGKIFELKTANTKQRCYIIGSLLLYLFQIYQNIKSSYQFYTNMLSIQNLFITLSNFSKDTLSKMNNYLTVSKKYTTYMLFNNEVTIYRDKLVTLNTKLQNNALNMVSLGEHMKVFYELYNDTSIQDTIDYALSFQGYLDNINGIQSLIKTKCINKCKYSKRNNKIEDNYYALVDTNTCVKNSNTLTHNFIITGPNAAGKTTFLKSTLINIILSQQIGYGFYKSAIINPYTYIHCYLNIPDTSNRDSLFQAEARRCKEILDNISDTKSSETIFCIFDELYSGTNPSEAVASAQAFLSYLSNKSNVTFMITTHYIELCSKLEDENTKNYNMNIIKKDDTVRYTYLLNKGISDIKGGVQVLKQLNYPEHIISKTKENLSNAVIQN